VKEVEMPSLKQACKSLEGCEDIKLALIIVNKVTIILSKNHDFVTKITKYFLFLIQKPIRKSVQSFIPATMGKYKLLKTLHKVH